MRTLIAERIFDLATLTKRARMVKLCVGMCYNPYQEDALTATQKCVALCMRQQDCRSEKGDGIMPRFVFSGESDDYRRRREELLAAEIALKDEVEHVAALRRALPFGIR